MTNTNNEIDIRGIEDFLYLEAQLLDDVKLMEWMELYDAEGKYWMPSSLEQTCAETEISILYESKLLMDVRRRNFGHKLSASMEYAIRGCRIIGNVRLSKEQPDASLIRVLSNFHAHLFYRDEVTLFAGKYTHDLKIVGGTYKIVQKRVDLINADGVQRNLLIYI